ncbi:hypothetical protein D3C86_1556210 [compost metagenome]
MDFRHVRRARLGGEENPTREADVVVPEVDSPIAGAEHQILTEVGVIPQPHLGTRTGPCAANARTPSTTTKATSTPTAARDVGSQTHVDLIRERSRAGRARRGCRGSGRECPSRSRGRNNLVLAVDLASRDTVDRARSGDGHEVANKEPARRIIYGDAV